jgi:hypothetical protein
MAEYLEDYTKLEDALVESLAVMATVVREEVAQRMLTADQAAIREAVTSLVWRVAAMLNGRVFSTTSDGREMLMTLGFVVRGSDSAFEEPFIEHEGMLLVGKICLTEYVHPAIDRAFES